MKEKQTNFSNLYKIYGIINIVSTVKPLIKPKMILGYNSLMETILGHDLLVQLGLSIVIELWYIIILLKIEIIIRIYMG